jgi:hypothetical protein
LNPYNPSGSQNNKQNAINPVNNPLNPNNSGSNQNSFNPQVINKNPSATFRPIGGVGNNNFNINQVGTSSTELVMALQPGFSGQLLVPVVDPTVFSSYYAVPGSLTYPSLLGNVISNSSTYYPTPENTAATTTRTVF